MKLTARVLLQPSPEQATSLRETLERVNAACNHISACAWDTQTFKQFSLHRLTYYEVRSRFDLTAQMAVRAISKVADAYKVGRKRQASFRPHGSIAYDDRVLSWRHPASTVSIWTVAGRQTIPFLAGERDRNLLAARRGESDLCLVDGRFYLFAACDVETPEPADVSDYLGVDLGVVNIATDSDGAVYSGGQVNGLRRRHRRTRQRLQRIGSKSTKRLLARRRRKERRFSTNINHTIAKRIVATAERTNRGIALEDLTHIRARVRVRRPQRATLHSWSFSQLRQFVAYKAALVGVPVVAVDPRNTSRTCPRCGLIDKANRPSQDRFLCVACNLAGLPDHFAAINIGRRAVVMQPDAAGRPPGGGHAPRAASRLL